MTARPEDIPFIKPSNQPGSPQDNKWMNDITKGAALKNRDQTITGTWTLGEIKIEDNIISQVTADGSDNSSVDINGGGGAGKERGARVLLFGNEHATNPAELYLDAGNVTGSAVRIRRNDVTKLTVDASNVTTTVPVIVPDDAFASDWDDNLEVPTKNAIYDEFKIANIEYSLTESNSAQSTTSTSLVNITQSDVTVTTATGDIVEITVMAEVSHSASAGQIIWNLRRGTTSLLGTDRRIFAPNARTDGQSACIDGTFIESPAAGTYTYRIAIRTSTGTVYIVPRILTVKVFKKAQ